MPDPYPLTSLADFADDVTVVPFHPRRAQWVKDWVKPLATVAHQHSTAGDRTPLVAVDRNLTGIRYRDEIVQCYVIPFIQAQANNVTFQQQR
jgi:hypothetical protein